MKPEEDNQPLTEEDIRSIQRLTAKMDHERELGENIAAQMLENLRRGDRVESQDNGE